MKLNKLDQGVLKLWYARAAVWAGLLIGSFAGTIAVLVLSDAPSNVFAAVSLSVGIPAFLLLVLALVLPYWRYQQYAWGYDSQRIIVKQGVLFRKRVVIPVCQIQDLHRFQGPLMMLFKLSGVTISTAGSNFNISTLTTTQADIMIDELEQNLETRIEELKNEKI